MSTLNVRYAVWAGRRQRRHRGSGLRIFRSESYSLPYHLPSAENHPMLDGYRLNFLFWSITGTINGPSVLFNRSEIYTIVPANDDSDAVATAIYAMPGEQNGPPGYDIDAFDVSHCVFLDDPFVIVGPDHNLTQQANDAGFVPTTVMENIQAYSLIYPEEFINWYIWKNMEEDSAETQNLSAAAHESATAFAFYRLPVGNPIVLNIPGPLRFKVPFYIPPESWLQFETGVSLAGDVNKFSKELRSDILTLSAKLVTVASESIAQEIRSMANGDQKLAPKVTEPVIKEKLLTAELISKKNKNVPN